MLIEVIRDNKVYMHTNNISCINIDEVDEQLAAGYKLKIDGKIVTKSQIASLLKCNSNAKASEDVFPHDQPRPKRKVRKVYCNETNKVYNNMSAAGRELGIDPAAISYAIQVDRPTTSGYSFKIMED